MTFHRTDTSSTRFCSVLTDMTSLFSVKELKSTCCKHTQKIKHLTSMCCSDSLFETTVFEAFDLDR